MIRRVCLSTLLFLALQQHVHGAMKKSWKSAANFDTDIPKFSPFDNEGDMMNKADAHLNEVFVETTDKPTSPSPSAETLVGKMSSKISSKIKSPPRHVAEVYNNLQKNSVKDFGVFDAEMAEEKPVEEPKDKQAEEATEQPADEQIAQESGMVKTVQDVLNEVTGEQIDVAQLIDELSEVTSKTPELVMLGNTEEADDGFEVTSIVTENTNTTQYKVGPLMNVTIDTDDSLVNVKLDQNTLKEIFTGNFSQSAFTAAIKSRKNNKTSSFVSSLLQAAVESTICWSASCHCLSCRSSFSQRSSLSSSQ
jgi:hypothetical protein